MYIVYLLIVWLKRCPFSCCYKKIALAYHIFNDHPEVLSEGPNNFAFGVFKQVDPRFLADAENLFIVQFKADTKHLNRYKALRFD